MSTNPESVQQLLTSDNTGDRIQGLNKLRELDTATAFTLVQPLLKDKNPRIRYAAVSLFDTVGHEDLTVSLELLRDRLFNDSEVDIQAAAADAIAALKLTDAFEDLRTVYHQTSEWLIQFSILAALGEMGDVRGFDLLKQALDSDNNLLNTAAIGAFGELGDPRAIPLIIPFATNDDWQIRHRLAQALVSLGGDEAQATLEKLANDDIDIVAQEAKRGIS